MFPSLSLRSEFFRAVEESLEIFYRVPAWLFHLPNLPQQDRVHILHIGVGTVSQFSGQP